MVTRYGAKLVEGRGWLLAIIVILAGLAIAYLPLLWAGALVLGSVAFLAIIINPLWGFYLLIFAIPFGSLQEVPIGVMSVGVMEILLALLLAVWLVRVLAARRLRLGQAPLRTGLRDTPLFLPLIIFILAISFSLLNALSLQYSLKGLLVWLEVLALYLFVASNLDEREAKVTVGAIFLAGSLEALLGIYQFLFGVGPESFAIFGRFVRAYGTFNQPNPFGGYMGLILPLAVSVAFARWQGFLSLLQGVAGLATGVIGVALVISWSRGAWFGFLVALGFVALWGVVTRSFHPWLGGALAGVVAGALTLPWFGGGPSIVVPFVALGLGLLVARSLERGWVWPALASLLLLIVLFSLSGSGSLVPTGLLERFLDFLPYLRVADLQAVLLTNENYAVIERLAHWRAAWEMISAHPLLGVGIGNYVPVYPAYALPGWEDPLGHAHNYYLNITAEAGLIGLGAYLFLFGAAFWHGLRVHQRAVGEGRAIALGISGVIVAFSVHSLFDNLYVHGMNLHLAILWGLLAVIDRSLKEIPCRP